VILKEKEVAVLEKIHDHIVSELGHSSRTDTIFVVTAVVFNLIVLGVNSAISIAATERDASATNDVVLAIFIVMTLLLNTIAVTALILGRRTRRTLLSGLVAMYQDNDVDTYYDPSLLSSYGIRYLLFAAVIVILALTSIVVPLIIRFF
jgi:hypothetical protein